MQTCVTCLALWMLVCVVNAHVANIADSSPEPENTTPIVEMVSRRPSSGEGANGEGADALGGAFHQVAQELLRVQEVLRLQEQKVATALRDLEQKLLERDEANWSLREECTSRIQRMEVKVNRMGEQLLSSTRRGDAGVGGHVSMIQLESAMDKLEARLQKAQQEMFPNLEAFAEHMKRISPSEAPSQMSIAPIAPSNFTSGFPSSSASTSIPPLSFFFPSNYATSPNSTSGSNSTTPTASTSTSPSPSSSHSPSPSPTTSTSTSTSTSPRPSTASDEARTRKRLLRRMGEAEERMLRTAAAPSRLGEQLLTASGNGSLEEVRRLLDSGADVNYHSDGWFPLYKAIYGYECNEAIVSFLLERGADVNTIDQYGITTLHIAAWKDRTGRVTAHLIGAGADLDARDHDGWSPLHWAAASDNEVTVHALVAAGANKTLKTWGGSRPNKTPFDFGESDAMRNILRV